MVKRVDQLRLALTLATCVVLLSGCYGTTQAPQPTSAPSVPTAPESVSPQARTIPANIPEPTSPIAIPPRQTDVFHGPTVGENRQVKQHPAVVALLDRSWLLQEQGDFHGAASNIERGMRIAPQDAALWQRLAQIRLQQGLFHQAIEVAKKSTSLGQGLYQLIRDNWLLIAKAHELLGDAQASQLARLEADRYQR